MNAKSRMYRSLIIVALGLVVVGLGCGLTDLSAFDATVAPTVAPPTATVASPIVAPIPDEAEATQNAALNFVTLGPRSILMAAENPTTQCFFESHRVTCKTVSVSELRKAAGAIGCLTGILEREVF